MDDLGSFVLGILIYLGIGVWLLIERSSGAYFWLGAGALGIVIAFALRD
jgi:hypothetical protein